MALQTFKIIPILGLKNDVPADDPTMFQTVAEMIALTHDTGGLNYSLKRQRNVCTKSEGYSAWSNSAPSSPSKCNLLFELDDGVNRDNLLFESGGVFYYDGSQDPTQIQNAYIDYSSLADGTGDGTVAAGDTVTGDTTETQATVVLGTTSAAGTLYIKDITGGTGDFSASETLTFSGGETADCDSTVTHTTFDNNAGDLYSAIRYGSYIVFTDSLNSGHPPQKWKNGEANIESLITGTDATLYKFKYLIEWQRRIIGAYSNQTNGDLEIRWTSALPTWTDLEFATANQLYKPGTDSITGISYLGSNRVLLYGTDSINEIVYYANADAPFGIIPLVQGQGTAGHHSIVNAQGANYLFNKNYGFVRYLGGSRITSDDIISKDIETEIASIDSRYYDRIVSKFIPFTEQIVWAVPLSAGANPTHLLYYDINTGQWTKEDKACRYIDVWTRTAGEYKKPVFGNTDGYVYQITGETLPSTSNLDGYRIEPIMDFGYPDRFKIVQEIWFGIVAGGSYSIDISWRSGNTVKEVLASSFSALGSISLDNPSKPVFHLNQSARYHQMKWQTNLDSEKFGINWITFKYILETPD